MNALEHAYRSTAPAARAVSCRTSVGIPGDTSHDHLSALVGPNVAFTLFPSAIYDTTCLRRESRKLYSDSKVSWLTSEAWFRAARRRASRDSRISGTVLTKGAGSEG